MKKLIISLCLLLSVVLITGARSSKLRQLVGVDALILRSRADNVRSALEIHPTTGIVPQQHALAEVVWYRWLIDAANFERFNISAMNDNEPMYRFGVEKGTESGEYRPIWFCFENLVVGQPAYCPLRIDPDEGVLVCNKQGTCQSIGG